MPSNDEAARYTRRSILRSEKMYGRGFQSPGQLPLMDAFCRRLSMVAGMQILDIGSGLGGAAFYFADRYQASVVGLDIAQAMIEISTERATEEERRGVQFVAGDIRAAMLPESAFDLAWSRDCILYVPEKRLVWDAALKALRPGGEILVTDFCRKPGRVSAAFETYVADCGYYLDEIASYAAGMVAAGFEMIAREDITPHFLDSLDREQRHLARSRDEFLREFDEADFDYLMTRWDTKRRHCREGDLRWGLFIGRKPA